MRSDHVAPIESDQEVLRIGFEGRPIFSKPPGISHLASLFLEECVSRSTLAGQKRTRGSRAVHPFFDPDGLRQNDPTAKFLDLILFARNPRTVFLSFCKKVGPAGEMRFRVQKDDLIYGPFFGFFFFEVAL